MLSTLSLSFSTYDLDKVFMDRDFTPWPEEVAAAYKDSGLWAGKSLSTILERSAKEQPNKVAIIDGKRQWTYQYLDARASQLAEGFLSRGLSVGDKVVLQLPNTGEFFEVIFGLFKIGVIPILSLPAHRQFEVIHFCQFAQAKAYVVAEEVDGFDYSAIARTVLATTSVEHVFMVGKTKAFTPLDVLYQTPTSRLREVQVLPAQVALLQLSGGTTSMPKLIPRTHDDYLYSIKKSVNVCEFCAHTVYLAALPVAHNFPLSSPGAFGVLSVCGTVVLAQSGAPDVAFPLIKKHRVTVSALVPPLVVAWLNAVGARRAAASGLDELCDLRSLSLLQVGGAKLSAAVAQRVKPILGCTLQQVFGMAEGLVNYARLNDDELTLCATQGKPMSEHDEILIVNDAGEPVVSGEAGHLLTRGPYTIRGYFRADEHNRVAFNEEGFYRTGDIARLTSNGYLQVEGRAKDQVNRGGEKISAEEVENQLLAHKDVLDVALVSIEDRYLGERACIFVRLKNKEAKFNLFNVKKFLRLRGLAEYKLPDRVEVVDEFPITSIGKVSKKHLRNMLSEKFNVPEGPELELRLIKDALS